jgi:hypothetical protein
MALTVTKLRIVPLCCRLGFHAWTAWYTVNDYRRHEPESGTEGLVVIRNFQEHRCLHCGATDQEYGDERRLRPEDAIAGGVITEYERKNLHAWPLQGGRLWREDNTCNEALGLTALLCRIGVHKRFRLKFGVAGCFRCGHISGRGL